VHMRCYQKLPFQRCDWKLVFFKRSVWSLMYECMPCQSTTTTAADSVTFTSNSVKQVWKVFEWHSKSKLDPSPLLHFKLLTGIFLQQTKACSSGSTEAPGYINPTRMDPGSTNSPRCHFTYHAC
jgi:hypothetical protein